MFWVKDTYVDLFKLVLFEDFGTQRRHPRPGQMQQQGGRNRSGLSRGPRIRS